jgi:rhodanese-related sulfurtransferase
MNTKPLITSPKSASAMLGHDQCVLVDVRTPVEFASTHVPGSLNIPLDRLSKELVESHPDLTGKKPVLLLCQSGKRASDAADLLNSGHEMQSTVVEGGLNQWITDELPVERDSSVISLERQVRIVAGLFVLLGVVLGFFINHALFGVSAFVGAGLVFAGITDTCGMGLFLARMPWNRRSTCMGSCPIDK